MADDINQKTLPLTQDQIAARARQIIMESISDQDRPAMTQEYAENLMQKALNRDDQANKTISSDKQD